MRTRDQLASYSSSENTTAVLLERIASKSFSPAVKGSPSKPARAAATGFFCTYWSANAQ
jgi:hypothetical protein